MTRHRVVGRRTLVLVPMACAALAALAVSASHERVYLATCSIELRDDLVPREEAVLIEGEAMRSSVAARLGTDELPPPAEVSTASASQLLTIGVRSGDAATAAAVANAYAATYIDVRGPSADTTDIQRRRAALVDSIDTAERAVDTLAAKADRTSDDDVLLDLFQQQVARLRADLAALDEAANGGDGGGVDLVPAATVATKATLPGHPIEPKMVRAVLLAIAAGFVIGLGAILLTERTDGRLEQTADVGVVRRRTGARIPIVGRIPHDDALTRRPVQRRRRIDDISATSVNALRDEVLFLGLEPPARVILVCGAGPLAGATTIATELALAISDYSSVVLIDLDLRQPEVHEMIGVPESFGVVDNLRVEPIDMTLTNVGDRFDVIAAGTPPPQPLGLLSRVRLDAMVAELRDRYDLVVLDTPDLESFGDATLLARLADAVLVVARLHETTVAAVRRAVRELESVRAPIMGFVVNDA